VGIKLRYSRNIAGKNNVGVSERIGGLTARLGQVSIKANDKLGGL
jgi:hypothetical protein